MTGENGGKDPLRLCDGDRWVPPDTGRCYQVIYTAHHHLFVDTVTSRAQTRHAFVCQGVIMSRERTGIFRWVLYEDEQKGGT